MRNIQLVADKAAFSLSFLCALHCLALPLLIILVPAVSSLPLADEAFHLWMVFGVIPISLLGLSMGCKKHQRWSILLIGVVGLAILIATPVIGHEQLGEFWEKTLTLLGASIIAISHYLNAKLCQACKNG